MYRDRYYMLIILAGSLAYGSFIIWLAFNYVLAVIAIIVMTVCWIAYVMKHAEVVAPDDNRYEKDNCVLS